MRPGPETRPVRTKEQIIDYLLSFDLFKGNEYEGYAYVHDAIGRFLLTVQMVPPAPAPGARLLELGANPYFTTLLLQRFHTYELTLANYFGERTTEAHGQQTIHSARYAETHTFDYDHFNVEFDRFPYDDNSFDGVLFCEILEHLTYNPTHTLAEISRVLKPGGFVLLTTPNVLRWQHVWDLLRGQTINDPYSGHGVYGRHNREYTPEEVVRLLGDCGYFIERVQLVNIHRRDAVQYLASGLRGHWCEHTLTLARASDLPAYRYQPWLYRSMVSLRRVVDDTLVIGQNDELHTGIGWYGPEYLPQHIGTVRWTQQQAEIFLRARGGENSASVDIHTGDSALGPVALTLAYGDHSQSFAPPPGQWQRLVVCFPAAEEDEEIQLMLSADHLRNPKQLGISEDTRNLGVMVRGAQMQPLTNAVQMGQNDEPNHLGFGWHKLDRVPTPLRWTHQQATAYVCAAGGEDTIVVEANSGVLGPVPVTLRCGPHSQTFALTEDAWTLLELPIEPCDAGTALTVTMTVDATRSPRRAGLSDDDRELGVMVQRVALKQRTTRRAGRR